MKSIIFAISLHVVFFGSVGNRNVVGLLYSAGVHNELREINAHARILHTHQFHKPFSVTWLAVIVDESAFVDS